MGESRLHLHFTEFITCPDAGDLHFPEISGIAIFKIICYDLWVINNPLQRIVYLPKRRMSIHFLPFGKILFQYAESEVIMDLNMNGIGERIKQRRKELGLSQIDIYNKCDITSGALSKIENGKTTPSIIVFYKLSQILQCDMDWISYWLFFQFADSHSLQTGKIFIEWIQRTKFRRSRRIFGNFKFKAS